MSVDRYQVLKTGKGKKLVDNGKAFQFYTMIKVGASHRKAWEMIGEPINDNLSQIIYDYYAREEMRRRSFSRPDNHIPNPLDKLNIIDEMSMGGESYKDLFVPAFECKSLVSKMSIV